MTTATQEAVTITAAEAKNGKVHRALNGVPQCGFKKRTLTVITPLAEEAVSCRHCINAREDETFLGWACPLCGSLAGQECTVRATGKTVRVHSRRKKVVL